MASHARSGRTLSWSTPLGENGVGVISSRAATVTVDGADTSAVECGAVADNQMAEPITVRSCPLVVAPIAITWGPKCRPSTDMTGTAMRKAPKYSGLLATSIDLHKLPLEGDLDALVQEELSKRIAALIERYHIDPGLPAEQVYLTLACRLAFDHVPAFRISRKRRAKPKWTLDKYRALVDAVDANR